MKLCALTAGLQDKPLEEALDILSEIGVEAVEIGTGAYPGDHHCKRAELLSNPSAQETWLKTVKSVDMEVAAFAVHGNPFHPDRSIGNDHDIALVETIELASQMNIPTVVAFSGLPGDSTSSTPIWPTNPWPPEQLENSDWQWDTMIQYWKRIDEIAQRAGVKIALEMHPNMGVHNPRTMLRLREATGESIGANIDPSHLTWRGMVMDAVIPVLRDCIHHVHAKETRTNWGFVSTNGCIDCTSFADEADRPWQFCTIGRGDIGHRGWCEIVNQLLVVGYDGVISLEHEDCLMSGDEGLAMAARFLKPLLPITKPGESFWA